MFDTDYLERDALRLDRWVRRPPLLVERGFELIGPTVRDGAIVLDRDRGRRRPSARHARGSRSPAVPARARPATTGVRVGPRARLRQALPLPAARDDPDRHAARATARSTSQPRPCPTCGTPSSGSVPATCTPSRSRIACSWTADPAYRAGGSGRVRRRELRDPRGDVLLRRPWGPDPAARAGSTSRSPSWTAASPRRPGPSSGPSLLARRCPARPTDDAGSRSTARSPSGPRARWDGRSRPATCRVCSTATGSTRAGTRWPSAAWRARTARSRARRASATTSPTRRSPRRNHRDARPASGRAASARSSATCRSARCGRRAASRYRQWLTHKFASWIDQFGTSGCVGCGRCITWCPVGIDVTEEIAAIRIDRRRGPRGGRGDRMMATAVRPGGRSRGFRRRYASTRAARRAGDAADTVHVLARPSPTRTRGAAYRFLPGQIRHAGRLRRRRGADQRSRRTRRARAPRAHDPGHAAA